MLALTLLPVPETVGDSLPRWFDKVVHFGLFASLAALLYWDRARDRRPGAASVVLPTAALAGLIELAQGPLPHRSGDTWDFVAGVVGSVVGLLVAAGWFKPPGSRS